MSAEPKTYPRRSLRTVEEVEAQREAARELRRENRSIRQLATKEAGAYIIPQTNQPSVQIFSYPRKVAESLGDRGDISVTLYLKFKEEQRQQEEVKRLSGQKKT
jgi:hypothetical protein